MLDNVKVGMRVKLSTTGSDVFIGDDSNNPYSADDIGTVVTGYDTWGWYGVAWDSGITNIYQPEHLDEVVAATRVPFTISTGSIVVVLGTSVETITSGNVNYEKIKEELQKDSHDVEVISNLINKKAAVESFGAGLIKIVGNTVTFNGEVVDDTLTDKMVSVMDEGFDVGPWAKFYENLQENPSFNSRASLFNFLEKFQAPFTEDGCFIAFKRVRENFMDIYSGTFDNSVGTVVKMERRNVNEDSSQTCSAGLHVAASSYLNSYASAANNKTIMVKVNPRDVVAVPHDYNFSKMRVCEYEVIADITVEQMAKLETKAVVSHQDYSDEYYESEEHDVWDEWAVGDVITFNGAGDDMTDGNDYLILYVDDEDSTVQVKDDAGDVIWLSFDGTYC
jgi:hypothetical protein